MQEYIGARSRLVVAAGAGALALVALGGAGGVAAQNYPNKPIRLIVPIAPGGATDIVSRLIGQHLGALLGQTIVIDNRPGAGGTIGSSVVANAAADGYTLMMGSTQFLSNSPNLYPALPYDADTAFTGISQISSSQFVLVVHPTIAVGSVRELIEYARAKPGGLNNGSGGNGSTGHLAMEIFKTSANIKAIHVPYKGSGPMVQALVAGQVQMAIVDLPPVLGFIREGKLRALGLSGAGKLPALPGVPSIAESGLKDYYVTSWLGLVAPAATPPAIIRQLHAGVVAAMKLPEMQKAILAQGMVLFAPTKPEEFSAFMQRDRARVKAVVQATGIRLE